MLGLPEPKKKWKNESVVGGELSQPPAPENVLAYEFDLISFWVETTYFLDGFWNVSFREGVFTYLNIYI